MNNQIRLLQQTFHRIIEGDDSFDLSDLMSGQDTQITRAPERMTSLYQSIKIHRSQIYPGGTDPDSCEEEEKEGGKSYNTQSHDQAQGQNQISQNGEHSNI